ncbi:MAG: transcription termination/antitermination protein NusA [Chloroflexi bacterium]|nr:transcription termination/antitermination protein NusA [Chloroflexota bacterium]
MKSDFLLAITQLSAEKSLPRAVVFKAVEQALAMAFKKESFSPNQNISVKIFPTTGEFKVYLQKAVVEEVTDPQREVSMAEALKIDPHAIMGGAVEIETTPKSAGRIAAQTAKQVVLQRLREAERDIVYEEYAEKTGEILSGVVQRVELRQIVLNLGKGEAILPTAEQVRTEHYRVGQRLKVYVVEVVKGAKGPQIVVSRTHRDLLRRLLEMEVPEIQRGIVEIKDIAREAGSRSKISVTALQEKVDAVGSCVGLRGIRIQNVVNELSGEKVDVVQWHSDPRTYIANALSPAPVIGVDIDPKEKVAQVVVADNQLSLAIGKEGQNARLAAKLTGWKIDIKGASVAEVEKATRPALVKEPPKVEAPVPAKAVAPTQAVPEIIEAAKVEAPAKEAPEELIFLAPEEKPKVPEEKPRIRFAEEVLGAPTRELEAKGKGVKAARVRAKGDERTDERTKEAAPARKRRPRLADLLEEEDLGNPAPDSELEKEGEEERRPGKGRG